jgi:Trk K+ transport system NAD-binding subunit
MAGHCIVCGMGDVAYRVVELLRRLGEEVVVVTSEVRDDRRRMAEARGVKILIGDARNEQLLQEAGLASAKAVVAVTSEDLVNIEVFLDAQRFRPDVPVVVRLFDQDLARQLEGTFGLRRALGMAALAAPSFAAAAIGESLLGTFSLLDTPFVVGRQPVGEGPLRSCASLGELAERYHLNTLIRERPGEPCEALPRSSDPVLPQDRLSLVGRKKDWDRLFSDPRVEIPGVPLWRRLRQGLSRLRALWREEPIPLRAVFLVLCLLIPLTVAVFHSYVHLPLADALFHTVANLHGEIVLSNDRVGPEIKLYEILLMVLGSITLATLYSMLTDYVVGSRLRKLVGGQPMPKRGHVVVVGMGSIGFQVVRELTAAGVPVVAVDAEANQPFLPDVRSRASVVVGDGRLSETLERAGVATARALVAAADNDSANLSIGLGARRLNPGIRTVVRLFDADFARKVESTLGIDVALGASRIAAPTFAASALFQDVVKAFIVQDRLLVLRLCKAGVEWGGRQPSNLLAEQGVAILTRDGASTSGPLDERPLREDEEVLAALWRKIEPPWSG